MFSRSVSKHRIKLIWIFPRVASLQLKGHFQTSHEKHFKTLKKALQAFNGRFLNFLSVFLTYHWKLSMIFDNSLSSCSSKVFRVLKVCFPSFSKFLMVSSQVYHGTVSGHACYDFKDNLSKLFKVRFVRFSSEASQWISKEIFHSFQEKFRKFVDSREFNF